MFDPENGSAASELFQQRLQEFVDQSPNVEAIEVRVKAMTGSASLIEALSAAHAAAPDALPSLIALPKTSLETAALKGLIYSMDELSSAIDDPDWYTYAREMSLIQGNAFGLPFAGDALILIYRPGRVNNPPTDWQTIFEQGRPLLFPASDPLGITGLALYQSAGGEIIDSQNRPTLTTDELQNTLEIFQEGSSLGVFPQWMTQYQSFDDVLDAYQNQTAHLAITWSSVFLTTLPADTSALPIPTLGENNFTIADGWLWGLSDPDPERRVLSVQLAEFLTDSDFLADWSEASGYLPTRPTALNNWSNQSLQSLIGQIVLSSQPIPRNDIINNIGPAIKDATLEILLNQSNPIDSASNASQRFQTD
jgi:ABC-type glycerol-3-phosphate transport system substrate-binding protein